MEVPVDVVLQASDWGYGEPDLAWFEDWELQTAAGDVVDVDQSVVGPFVHFTPTDLLLPGDYVWVAMSSPRGGAVNFTVVDAFADELEPPELALREAFVVGEAEVVCGPAGTYQMFFEDDAYAMLVVASSADLDNLREAIDLDDVPDWKWWDGSGVYVGPGRMKGVRFGAFDAAGRFTGWGPMRIITGVPLEADPTPYTPPPEDGGCASTTTSTGGLLVLLVLGFAPRRRRT